MHRRSFAALLATTLVRPRAWLAGLAAATVVKRDLMVRMRDGVHLATDVYLPADDGARFPVILERTPYNKEAPSRSERTPTNPTPLGRAAVAEFFVRRGYAVVYQDCRGRYKSEGEFVKYLSDGDDGFDCCRWILDQPWSNGRIGTMGLSYAAHTQGALGCAGAPGVAAMWLDSGGFSNAYQGGIRTSCRCSIPVQPMDSCPRHALHQGSVLRRASRRETIPDDARGWCRRSAARRVGHRAELL